MKPQSMELIEEGKSSRAEIYLQGLLRVHRPCTPLLHQNLLILQLLQGGLQLLCRLLQLRQWHGHPSLR